MEKSVIVLLLLCAVSSAHRGSSEEESPQDSSDVHAVLREMTAALAEHKVKIEQLQTLNQEQAAKLERQTMAMDTLKQEQQEQATKLKEIQTGEVDPLKEQLREQAAKLREVDTLKIQQQEHAAKLREVDPMKEQLKGQAAQLNSLKAWANVTENYVDSLRRDREVGQVAFSASLLSSGSRTFGPYNTHTTLVFRRVISNIGNGYSPSTGFFTAPVRGAYHFEFHIGAHGDSSHASSAGLVKNGHRIVVTYEHQTNGYGKSSNGAILLLKAGDVVFLQLWHNTKIYDNENHHCTFSGHLLFPM